MTRFLPLRSATSGLAAAMLVLATVAPSVAQDETEAEAADHTTVTGQVVDASTGGAVATTVVRMTNPERSVMTDQDGRFSLTHVPVGTRTLVFEQLGYTRTTVTQEFHPESTPIVVELEPQPVVLEGLDVMVDRLEARRQAAGVAVRVLRPEDFQSQPVDLFAAIRGRAGMGLIGCTPRGGMSTWCILNRGSYVVPSVWVDDRRAMGIEELELYRTDDVYAVEIYQAGRAIRVYTRQYMQKVAMNPRAVQPVWGW